MNSSMSPKKGFMLGAFADVVVGSVQGLLPTHERVAQLGRSLWPHNSMAKRNEGLSHCILNAAATHRLRSDLRRALILHRFF